MTSHTRQTSISGDLGSIPAPEAVITYRDGGPVYNLMIKDNIKTGKGLITATDVFLFLTTKLY